MEPTLNQALRALGLSKRSNLSRSIGSFDILKDGAVVFTGDAQETWAWLHRSGLLA